MSQENLDTIKNFVAASQHGEWEVALETYDPAVEFDVSRMLGGGVGVGREAVSDFFSHWFGTYDRLSVTPKRRG
jgi:hypothetical protein